MGGDSGRVHDRCHPCVPIVDPGIVAREGLIAPLVTRLTRIAQGESRCDERSRNLGDFVLSRSWFRWPVCRGAVGPLPFGSCEVESEGSFMKLTLKIAAALVVISALLPAASRRVLAQSGKGPTPAQVMKLDADVEASRVYIKVTSGSRLGHDHGVAGRLESGWVKPGIGGEIVFAMRTFITDTPEARRYVGLTAPVKASDQKKSTANMLVPTFWTSRVFLGDVQDHCSRPGRRTNDGGRRPVPTERDVHAARGEPALDAHGQAGADERPGGEPVAGCVCYPAVAVRDHPVLGPSAGWSALKTSSISRGEFVVRTSVAHTAACSKVRRDDHARGRVEGPRARAPARFLPCGRSA